MRKTILVAVAAVGVACGATEDRTPLPRVTAATPAEYSGGEDLFDANCRQCHGERGTGTASGPPLVHRIYEPSHHGDESFQRAAALGAQAHHWGFGNMPPVAGVTRQQVSEIIGYVRWLQREAGIM